MVCRLCRYVISKLMVDFGLGERMLQRRASEACLDFSFLDCALGRLVSDLGLGVRASRRHLCISLSWIEVLDCRVFNLGLEVVSKSNV